MDSPLIPPNGSNASGQIPEVLLARAKGDLASDVEMAIAAPSTPKLTIFRSVWFLASLRYACPKYVSYSSLTD